MRTAEVEAEAIVTIPNIIIVSRNP